MTSKKIKKQNGQKVHLVFPLFDLNLELMFEVFHYRKKIGDEIK
jgi:hypothetical protein